MPDLVIGNVDNEHMVGETWRMTYEMKCTSSIVANRLTWLLKDGDAMVAPYPISPDFLAYVCALTGVDSRSLTIVVPPGGYEETRLLTFDVLSDPDVVNRLRDVMGDPGQWTVTPYYHDRTVAWLAGRLGMKADPHFLNFAGHGGAEQLNSKVEFRRLAAGYDIPVPPGAICSSLPELRAGLQDLMGVTGAVVVKQDLNAGGDGNIVITTGPETVSAGAVETVSVDSADLAALAERLWNRLVGPHNTTLVVEAYYRSAAAYYSELEMCAGGRRPSLLNFGEMRMAPLWVGFEIPCRTLAPYQLGQFLSLSMKLADIAQARGYVGKINCDAIRTGDGRMLFTEVNGRLGGCTHIHVLAQRLFGHDYGDRYTLLTGNKVKSGPFLVLLDRLDREGLLYTAERGEGAVILTEDTRRTGTVEYMVAASEAQRAHDLEQRTLAAMETSRGEDVPSPARRVA